MLKKIVAVALSGACLLPVSVYSQSGGSAAPQNVKTIVVKNAGSCTLGTLDLNPMWAPAGMKENEKAFTLWLKCSPEGKATADDFKPLSEKGNFVTPDGQYYKVGAAMVGNKDGAVSYGLSVNVLKTVDVEKLKFVLDGQTLPLAK